MQSAGSRPTGRVHLFAVRVLRENYDVDARQARSKSWDEFRGVAFDCVITVCGNAKQACLGWLTARITAHWGSPDPAAITGSDEKKYTAFVEVAEQIARRAELLCALPLERLTDAAAIQAIGEQATLAEAPVLH